MTAVIRGFFYQLPWDKRLTICKASPKHWCITCNWYGAHRVIDHLRKSYPQFTFTLGGE